MKKGWVVPLDIKNNLIIPPYKIIGRWGAIVNFYFYKIDGRAKGFYTRQVNIQII